MPRPPLNPAGGRSLLTLSLPPGMVEELRRRYGNAPLAPIVRGLLSNALEQENRAKSDMNRLAQIAAYIRSVRKDKTTQMHAKILRGWAMDIIRQVPSMPGNPDWRELMTYLNEQPQEEAVAGILVWARSSSTWRQEWTAGLGRVGHYGIAEQPGQGHWSVNFYDHNANIYAVDGMVLAGSLEEAKAACERDAADRRAQKAQK